MILSMKTENKIIDLKNLEDIFDFIYLDENQELFSNKNKKVIYKFKTETPKIFWINEFVCSRSKAYSFKCKNNDENKNKIKGIFKSQSKHITLKSIKNVWMERKIKENAIITFFVQLTMKCVFRK